METCSCTDAAGMAAAMSKLKTNALNLAVSFNDDGQFAGNYPVVQVQDCRPSNLYNVHPAIYALPPTVHRLKPRPTLYFLLSSTQPSRA